MYEFSIDQIPVTVPGGGESKLTFDGDIAVLPGDGGVIGIVPRGRLVSAQGPIHHVVIGSGIGEAKGFAPGQRVRATVPSRGEDGQTRVAINVQLTL